MATRSSVLAWRIPGTGSLVGCSPWGRTELDTTEVTLVVVVTIQLVWASQIALVVKSLPANAGDLRDPGSIPGRSPGGGHINPLQYPCQDNSIDRGAWLATIYKVAKSWTGLK